MVDESAGGQGDERNVSTGDATLGYKAWRDDSDRGFGLVHKTADSNNVYSRLSNNNYVREYSVSEGRESYEFKAVSEYMTLRQSPSEAGEAEGKRGGLENIFSMMLTGADGTEELVEVFKYKKVANKVRPVPATLPEEFRIVRRAHPNPLEGMPEVPVRTGEVRGGERFTRERLDALDVDPGGFLWPEEKKLVHWLLVAHERAFAWDETGRGAFKAEYFDPILIPTMEHVPFTLRNMPIPPGIFEEIVRIIKEKIAAGVYEPSNSSYRTRWFCVLKKDGKSLRLVHDLQPLNAISVRDAAVPPKIDELTESFAGRACYTVFDLLVAFDQRALDPRSRDFTTFQTPLGTFRLTSIPMGYTNSAQILQNDVNFIFRDEIPHLTVPYADDIPVKGPKTRYERSDGTYETIEGNDGVRRFVFEHVQDLNVILQKYGGTFSGKKLQITVEEAVIVGHKCSYRGREPDDEKVQKIRDWPDCETVTDVRGFLGTCGIVRNYIKGFAKIAKPLVDLTRKGADFRFEDEERAAFQALKDAVLTCPALRPIDYASEGRIILAVDSSPTGWGMCLCRRRLLTGGRVEPSIVSVRRVGTQPSAHTHRLNVNAEAFCARSRR